MDVDLAYNSLNTGDWVGEIHSKLEDLGALYENANVYQTRQVAPEPRTRPAAPEEPDE